MEIPKKSLSQNFLIDHNISNKILKLTNVTNRTVLEIGPGYGFLTDKILSHRPSKLILIEKDITLSKLLINKYKNEKKVIINCVDILKYDINNYNNLIIISNLPYNVSTKIILYLLNFNKKISEMIFMIQKEVSEKFDYNLYGMNKYKFITKILSTYTRCFDVSNKVFIPKPKIKSTVVKFKINKKNVDLSNAYRFSNLIFKNVRKKIKNNIEINKRSEILNKRVNQLSINELLYIYNFF